MKIKILMSHDIEKVQQTYNKMDDMDNIDIKYTQSHVFPMPSGENSHQIIVCTIVYYDTNKKAMQQAKQ